MSINRLTVRQRRGGARSAGSALILLLALAGGGAVVWAQGPALPAAAVVAAGAEAEPSSVRLLVGRSTVLEVGTAIARVSLTSAEIADALVTSPSQLLINGKTPGTISMFVWDRGGSLRRYEVVVQRDLARLGEQMRELFPGEQIAVQSNGKNVILTGLVSSKDVIEKAISVAAGYVDKREEVTALLQLQPGAPSNQVLLRVRFAEVSRSALTELGSSFFTSPLGVNNTIGRVTTQQYAAPGFDKLQWAKESGEFGAPVTNASGEFTFSDFLNLFFFNQQYDLGMMVKALQTKGLFQSLAEPNLVSESGKEASFLAGGEFPVPVVQGTGGNTAVSIMFKEFGIRLSFTPTVTEGGRIHLKVKPEVSTLDFNNAVVLQGFRIPALTTRRTETELELQNGQTFAIAGLMNNTMRSSLQKIPGIGDIPILGLLFQSKAAQKEQTELVVMITPEIIPNGSRGVTPNLPRLPEPYLPPLPDRRTVAPPPPAFGAQQRSGDSAPVASAPTPARTPAATNPPSAADAAAAVSALTPSAPRIVNPAPAAPPTPGAPGVAAPASAAATEAGTAEAAPPPAPRPLSAEERKRLERARREEQARAKLHEEAYARAQEAEGRRVAEEQVKQKRLAEQEQERQQKLAREQAVRDAQAVRRAQEVARQQAKRDAESAKRAQEAARRRAERDREQQKALDEAAARLEAAESAYAAELKRKDNP